MWSRVVEAMLGCWLLISPFVFGYPADRTVWWVTDFGAGLTVIVFALTSYWRPARYAHLLNLIVAATLIGIAYGHVGGHGVAATYQNQAIVGLLLLMFAVIPNQASCPPDSWETQRRLRAESSSGTGL